MKKKNGFTLIELVAIILILGVIYLIISPIITDVIDESEQKALANQKKELVDITKKYVLDHDELLPEDDSVSIVTIETLRQAQLLREDAIIDPTTNEEMNGCVIISYNDSKSNYFYEYSDECE